MKKRMGFRTKLQAGIGLIVIVMLFVSSAFSATIKIGTDSGGTSYAYVGHDLISTSNTSKLYALTETGLQSAIWDLNGTDGNVYIPDCTLTLTKTIYVNSQVRVRGSGIAATQITVNAGVLGFEVGTSADGGYGGELSGFKLTGGKTGIFINNTADVLIEEIEFWEQTMECLRVNGSSYNVNVRRCRFVPNNNAIGIDDNVDGTGCNIGGNVFSGYSNSVCINVSSNSSQIHDNIFEHGGAYGGIHITLYNAQDTSITGNRIGTTRTGEEQIRIGDSSTLTQITGNTFDGANTSCINFTGGAGNYHAISGNSFSQGWNGYSINISGGNHITISGNTFDATSAQNPKGVIYSSSPRWISVTGNDFEMNTATDVAACTNAYVFGDNTVHNMVGTLTCYQVTGNRIAGGDKTIVSYGIYNPTSAVGNEINNVDIGILSNLANAVISDNVIGASINTDGIRVATNPALVCNNRVAFVGDSIQTQASAGATDIVDNYISGSINSGSATDTIRGNIGALDVNNLFVFPVVNNTVNGDAGLAWFDSSTDRLYTLSSGGLWRYFETANNVTASGGGWYNQDLNITDDVNFSSINASEDRTLRSIRNSNGKCWSASGANLELAIDDANDSGWVEVPAGTISVSQDIDLFELNNFTLRGYGCELEVSNSASFAGSEIILVYGCDNITIEGFELDGNHPWNTSASDNYSGLGIRKTSNSVFRDLNVHNVIGDGIVIADGTTATYNDERSCNNIISDNYVHHIGDIHDKKSAGDAGIRIMGVSDMDNNIIENNRIEYIREHGIKVYGYAAIGGTKYNIHDNNKILNNVVSQCNLGDWDGTGDPYGRGIVSGGINTLIDGNTVYANRYMEHAILGGAISTITNNHIEFIENAKASSYGIWTQKTASTLDIGTTYISNNLIEANDYSNTRGIGLDSNLENSSCIQNRVFNTSGVGIWADCYHSDISHNKIYDAGADGIAVYQDYNIVAYNEIIEPGDEGIGCSNVNYCDISHNIIKSSADRGIDLYGDCSWTTLSYNRLEDITQYGIEFKSGSRFDFFDVSHNFINSSAASRGIILDNVHNSTVSFNLFDGLTHFGIVEYSDCHWLLMIGNNAQSCGGDWDMHGKNNQNTTNIPTM